MKLVFTVKGKQLAEASDNPKKSFHFTINTSRSTLPKFYYGSGRNRKSVF